MIEVSVCLPYRPSGDFRDDIANWVINWWRTHIPENWEVVTGTDDGKEMINRGKMRNDAAQKATGEILLFCDVDCVIPEKDFPWIVKNAKNSSLVCYRSYVKLNDLDTRKLMSENVFPDYFFTVDKTGYKYTNRGPVMAVSREHFDAVYGWPELEGWGEEDPIMWCKLQTLFGPKYEMLTRFFHLEHPTKDGDPTSEWCQRNASIGGEYYKASLLGKEYFLNWLKETQITGITCSYDTEKLQPMEIL